MAKKKKDEEKKEALKLYIKARVPAIFEGREPAPAYAEGALNEFIEDLLEIIE